MTFNAFVTADGVSQRESGSRGRGPRDPADWLDGGAKSSLYKRALKRYEAGTVQRLDDDHFIVEGMEKLSDGYPEYAVVRSGKYFNCECRTHSHGQYRKLCTHSIAVMIWRHKTWQATQSDATTTDATNLAPSKSDSLERNSTPTSQPSGANSTTPQSMESLIEQTIETAMTDPDQLALSPPEDVTLPSSTKPGERSQSPESSSQDSSPRKKFKGKRKVTDTDASSSIDVISRTLSPSVTSLPVTSAEIPVETVSDLYYRIPDWLTHYRDFQVNVVDQVMEAFETNDVVIINAPTGTGKSLIGWMIGQRFKGRGVYLASDKSLQDQYLGDFEDVGAVTLKGRVNYLPQITSDPFGIPVTCDDCDKNDNRCSWCPSTNGCAYTVAKQTAIRSPLPVLNYAYMIREAGSSKPAFSGLDFAIADECDVLEDVLLGQAEVVFSEKLRRRLNLGQPDKLTDGHVQWLDWLMQIHPILELDADEAAREARRNDSVKTRRRARFAANRLEDCEKLIAGIQEGLWVLTGYRKSKTRKRSDFVSGPLVFKPVKVEEFGKKLLFRHARKWVLMSATPISSEELADSLGINVAGLSYTTIDAPMTFPVDRRRCFYAPVGEMKKKKQDETLPDLLTAVTNICNAYPGERAIIHTVSYALTDTIAKHLKYEGIKTFTYKGSQEKEETLERFFDEPGAVLIGPSIGRGTDFKDDRARINIIVKMPFPYLGDDQVSARLYGTGRSGQLWYTTKTVREIVQAYGRTTRSVSDWSLTFILDAGFGRLMRENRSLFPEWFREAVSTSVRKAALLDGRNLPTIDHLT